MRPTCPFGFQRPAPACLLGRFPDDSSSLGNRLTFTAPARLRFRRTPLRCFRSKMPTPPFDGTGEGTLVPSDSRLLAIVASHPFGHAQPPFEPDDPIDFDRKRSMCRRWSYTPREPSRAHGKLTLSHGFGLQRTQLTSTPASRASDSRLAAIPMGRSTQPNGPPHRGAPVSEPMLGLCTAPVRVGRPHTFSRRAHSAAWNSRQPLLDVSRQVG